MMTMGQPVGSCPSANGADGRLWLSSGRARSRGESPDLGFALELPASSREHP